MNCRLYIGLLGLSLLGPGLPTGGLSAAEGPLVSWSFVGSHRILSNTNAVTLGRIAALPESGSMRDRLTAKLAGAITEGFGGQTNLTATLQPLLVDLFQLPSMGVIDGPSLERSRVALAIKVEADHVPTWTAALKLLLPPPARQSAETVVEGFKGESWNGPADRGLVRIIRAGSWLVVTLGDAATGRDFFLGLKNAGTPGRMGDEWLRAEIDWPRLGLSNPLFKPARTTLTVNFRDDNLRMTGRVVYPESLKWQHGGFKIPTNIIVEPLISFTALQNPGAFLTKPLDLRAGDLHPEMGPVYFWAQSQMPFQTYLAFPVNNASNRLRSLVESWPKAWNETLTNLNQSQLAWDTNRNGLAWRGGLAILSPYLEAVPSAAGEFFVTSFFPPTQSRTAPPDGLLKEISEIPNLAAYDWEITQTRLMQWRGLSQLAPWFPLRARSSNRDHLQLIASVDSGAAAQKWLTAVAPLLGNTVTQVTVPSANEAAIVRKSHLGLTGFELVVLGHWLTDPVPLHPGPRTGK